MGAVSVTKEMGGSGGSLAGEDARARSAFKSPSLPFKTYCSKFLKSSISYKLSAFVFTHIFIALIF